MYPSSLFRARTASQHKRVSIHVLLSTSILDVPTDQPKYSRRSHAQMPLKRHRQCLDPCRDFYVNVTVRDQLAERNICGVKSRFSLKEIRQLMITSALTLLSVVTRSDDDSALYFLQGCRPFNRSTV